MANTRRMGAAPLFGGHNNYWARKNESLRNIENLSQNDQIIALLKWQGEIAQAQAAMMERQVQLLDYLAQAVHRLESERRGV